MKQDNDLKVHYLKSISPEALHNDYILQDKIVVLTDVVKNWSAANLTMAKIKENYGQRDIRIRAGSRLDWRTLCRTKLGEYIDYLTSPNGEYLGELNQWREMNPYGAFNVVDGIDNEVNFSDVVPEDYELTPNILWIGPKGSLTPMHYDDSGHTFFAQLVGKKVFKLYPYNQTKYLYKSNLFDFMSVFSEVNIDEPDYIRHPKYKYAKGIDVVVNPGELLVIPIRMWHQVLTLEDSISICTRGLRHNAMTKFRHGRWYLKALAHLVGAYKRKSCLCHIVPWDEQDLAIHKPIVRFLAHHGFSVFHQRDLSDIVNWR